MSALRFADLRQDPGPDPRPGPDPEQDPEPGSEADPGPVRGSVLGSGPRGAHRPLWGAVVRPAAAPEPVEWRPRPTFRERALRAVTAPLLVGAVLFGIAVVAGIVIVLVQPHAPDPTAGAAAGSAAEPILGESGSALGAGGTAGSASAAAPLFVHVVGEVRSPGVVELQAGARVQDAIAAAGGATEDAVLAGVNLARTVGDGEQLVVPDAEGAPAVSASGGAPGATDSAGGLLDLNAADVAALETLPRVGPALAQRIVDWRTANGRFSSVDQLLEVPGIGQKTLDGFRERVRV